MNAMHVHVLTVTSAHAFDLTQTQAHAGVQLQSGHRHLQGKTKQPLANLGCALGQIIGLRLGTSVKQKRKPHRLCSSDVHTR